MSLLARIKEIAQRAEHAASDDAQRLWAAIQSEWPHQAQPSTLNDLESELMANLDALKAAQTALHDAVTQLAATVAAYQQKLAEAVSAAQAGDQAGVDEVTTALQADAAAAQAALTPPAA